MGLLGSCQRCFAQETSSAMAYHSTSSCCLPAVSSRLICSQHLPKLQRRNHRGYCLSDLTLPGEQSEKLCGEAKPLAPAANTAGNFLWCPPLPIDALNAASVDDGRQRGSWPSIPDLCVNGWQNDGGHSFGFLRKGHTLGGSPLNIGKHFSLSHFSARCRQRALLRRTVIRIPALSGRGDDSQDHKN